MKFKILAAAAAIVGLGLVAPQHTPKSMAAAYGALADTILAVKRTEAELVRSILGDHYRAAKEYVQRGDSEHAGAEIALFANEGDNAIGGVRKRLLEGGHHHNADGEAKGAFEPGFVIVTRKAREDVLAAASAMRQAKTDAERKQAWDRFASIAYPLVQEE
jgi:hypothetical protein